MANLAIIPARGGSKRISGKNCRDFLGKPIIAYSIDVAIKSALFDEVMVSTDDAEIAKTALKYGAAVPFMRSAEISDDHAALADVVEEVKEEYAKLGRQFQYICCMLPTAPHITRENLKRGLQELMESGADSVRPVVRYPYPVQRAFRMNKGELRFLYPEYVRTRSQDLEPAYHDAGQFYWMRYGPCLRGEKRRGFAIRDTEAHDIDNEEDWVMAELKYMQMNKNKKEL